MVLVGYDQDSISNHIQIKIILKYRITIQNNMNRAKIYKMPSLRPRSLSGLLSSTRVQFNTIQNKWVASGLNMLSRVQKPSHNMTIKLRYGQHFEG